MKLSRDRSPKNKKTLITVISALFILAAIVTGVIYVIGLQGQSSDDTAPTKTTNSSDSQSGSTNKSPSQEKQDFLDSDSKGEDTEKPAAQTNITLAAQTQGENVIITTNLGTIPSGECTVIVKSGSLSKSQSAEVIYSPEYSTCAGFSIKRSELPGVKWGITLEVKSPSGNQTKTINYEP